VFEKFYAAGPIDGYDVVVCEACGAGFADQIPEQAVLDAYYRDFSKYEYAHRGGQGSKYDDLRFRQAAATMLPHIPGKKSRVLEIGCATGQLLSLLKERGYENVQGVDPSPACTKAAWDLYGIPVQAHSIFDIPKPDLPFDFLILTGVLEHIRDLDLAVEALRELLRPGGKGFLAVPDAASFSHNIDAPFQEFSVEHLNFFSATSLRNLMRVRQFRWIAGGPLSHEPSRGTRCFSLYGVFENVSPECQPIVRDEETEPGLSAYIRKCQNLDEQLRATIARATAGGRRILVWGTGTHTLRLLVTGGLANANIAAFVDSNSKYVGQQLHGIPVVSPDALAARQEPILISSFAAQHEIERIIREKLGLKNELILLYDI
jgi:SAM-dependent methyltransferase